VDYATDATWRAWNDEALRRFLNQRTTKPPNERKNIPGIGNLAFGTPVTTFTKPIPKSWKPLCDEASYVISPLISDEPQDMRVKTGPMYGDVTQMVALKNNNLDFEPVSLHVQIVPSCIWNQLIYTQLIDYRAQPEMRFRC
jgi:hypothetical protein